MRPNNLSKIKGYHAKQPGQETENSKQQKRIDGRSSDGNIHIQANLKE